MNPLTLEWVEKAEVDLITAGRGYRARKSPNFDTVCFQAQQAAESI
jgi:HEPN domain-containing protein